VHVGQMTHMQPAFTSYKGDQFPAFAHSSSERGKERREEIKEEDKKGKRGEKKREEKREQKKGKREEKGRGGRGKKNMRTTR
jgi:hypothetical protein